jgi:flagellar motor switch protein FliN/FliY
MTSEDEFDEIEEPTDEAPEVAGDQGVVYDIPIEITAVLGVASLKVNQLLKLGRGAVVELDRTVGQPIDLRIDNRLIGRGEVVVVDDHLAVTLTEITKVK